MPQRNNNVQLRNGGFTTRSSNRGSLRSKEPQTAAPPTLRKTSRAPANNSPLRKNTLPASNNNKPSPKNVSSSPGSTAHKSNERALQDSIKQSINSVDQTKAQNNIEVSSPNSDHVRATAKVSDNRGSQNMLGPSMENAPANPPSQDLVQQSSNVSTNLTSDFTPISMSTYKDGDPLNSTPSDPWHLTYMELRAIRLEFAQQLQTITNRTASTESKVSINSGQIKEMGEHINALQETIKNQQQVTESTTSANSAKIQEMGQQILTLKETIDNQRQTIHDLNKVKQEFAKSKQDFTQSSNRSVSEMNKLLEQQRQQVLTLRDIRQNIQHDMEKQQDELQSFKTIHTDIQKDVQQQFKQVAEDGAFKEQKEQAFKNRYNIVIIGLQEHETYNDYSVASHFFKTKLNLKKLRIQTAWRRGQIPSHDNNYIRPLVVTFARLIDRNLVWRRRKNFPKTDGDQHIKIQADLPKQLRDGLTILYRVLRAAKTMEDYKTASIREFALVLHGKQYSANQLETLPVPHRPSSLAVKKSDQVLVFFTKFSVFSNHSPSTFSHQDKIFHNMEQFLAFKRAEISQQPDLAERALQANDPAEAKAILHFLRNDHAQEWQTIREETAAEGLREKFLQNPALAEFLKSTQDYQLGEASKNPVWGVGMSLEDDEILDTTKWDDSGNLLGKLLMRIRSELLNTPNQAE